LQTGSHSIVGALCDQLIRSGNKKTNQQVPDQEKDRLLDAAELLRRFLLHVLPAGLVRIRQFGFLANRVRKPKRERCRTLLAVRLPSACADHESGEDADDPHHCPICKLGRLMLVEFIGVEQVTIPDELSYVRFTPTPIRLLL
jgi:hypothetical protein